MKKALRSNFTSARTIARKILFTKSPGRVATLLILVAMVATLIVSPTFSAKSPENPSRSASSNSLSNHGHSGANAKSSASNLFIPTANLANEGTPSLTTDKESYSPGEPITFTGTDWTPGEVVTIAISADPNIEGTTLEATADDSGSFTVVGTMPDTQISGSTTATATRSVGEFPMPTATASNSVYMVTATGATSGATAQAQISVAQASVNVPTPGCGSVLTPDVVDFLRTKPNDPMEDYEAWRQEHPNMVEVPMPLQCRSEAWRVLHGLMEQPATQVPEPTSAASSPFVGDAVAGPDADMGGGVSAYQGEVNIAVDPNNPLHLVAGANTFYRDPSAACQSPTGGSGSTFGTQALYGSTDGGQTWTYRCAPWNPSITGGVSGATAWFGSDPAMAYDNAGNAYAVYMLVNQNSAGTSSGSSIVIAKSTDNGTTWSNLGVIVNHETVANPFDDKEMVVIDNTVGQPNSHTGRIYVIWDENNVERVAYSDNGTSWTTVIMGSGTEIGGNIAVAADGTVWAAWNHYSQSGGVGAGDSLYVKKSTDGGVTWTAPATNPIVTHNLASFGTNNKPAAQDSRGINAFPIIDVDRNTASANFGRLYIAYSDFPPSTGSGNDLNVYMINSGNGGLSWSSQVLVNDDGGTSTQFFPWMSVDQSDGTVNLTWLDTRNFSANNRQTQTYTARSINGGASFEANVSVEDSGANFRNSVNYSDDNTTDNSARNGNQYGDYEGVVAANRISHPIWTDTRNFYPSADTQSPARAEDAVACSLTNCSAPSSVAAPSVTTACSVPRVQLSWSAPSGWGTSATSGTYSVYRSTTSTFPGGTPIASGLTTTSYDDSSGTPGVAYYYFVQAKNNCPGTALTPMSTTSAASASVVFPSCGPTGILQGTVTSGGSNVSGVTITAGPYSTTTNASGFYQFPAIATGTYTVTASATGYNTATANNVSVTQNNTTVQDFTLTPTTTSACLTDTTQGDFSAGTGTNVDLNSSPGNVKLSLTGSEAIDQQMTNVSTTGQAITTTAWEAQTFVPSVSGNITRLDVDLFCSACSGTNPNITADIRTTSGGAPTSTILATTTITGFSSGSGTFYTATFSTPATLTSGTTYAFVLRLTTDRTTGTYAILRSSNDQYLSGAWYSSTNSGGSWAAQSRDLGFKTYMTPITYQASGNLVSSLKDSNPVVGATTTWTTLSWTATTPANTSVKFQVAGSNNAAGPFNFVGPDGTAATFFTTSGASLSQFNGLRYLKYQAFLTTTNSTVTPTLSDVTVCYSDGAIQSTNLAVNSASGTYGGTTNLSATLTSGGNPVSGKTINFTLNGNSVGSAVTNSSGVATLSNASLSGINAGSYPNGVGASFATDSSYSGNSGSNSLTVSKAQPSITWSNPASIVYGTALGATQLNATASVAGTFAYTPASGTVLHAGNAQNLHVDFTPTDTTNYNTASRDVQINVTKATLTVTADNQSKSYRAANPTLTYTPTGFVNGDTSGVLSGSPSLSTTATTNSNVGSYPITITQGTLSAADYTFSFVNGTLTVTKATPVINWSNPSDITYGTALGNTQLNATATNPNDGSSVAGSFNYNPASGAILNAGNNQTLATNFTPTDTANYNTLSQKTVSINVSKAALTVTADDKSRVYGDANPTFTASYTGFVNNDTSSSLSGTLSFATSATQSTPVGTYSITPSGLSSSNYTITFANGTLTVTKASLTVTAADANREYGDPNPSLTGTLNGVKNSDNITASYSTSATPSSNVGSYTIVPALNDPDNKLGNYNVTSNNGTLTITKAALANTANDAMREYGDANPTFTGTLSGIKNSDNITVTYASSATPSSSVGTYSIVPTLSDPDSKLGNYNVTSNNGTLTVTKAALSVSAANAAREYGDANPSFSGTLTGIKNSDNITASYSTAAVQGSAVGSYDIVPSLNDPDNRLGNYNVTSTNGTLTITKAALSVTAANAGREYGDANPAFTGTLNGIKNGDNITASYSSAATQASAVGSYAITPSLSDSDSRLGNYNVTLTDGTLTITQAALSVTAANASRTYGAANPAFTGTITGIKNGDNITATYASSATPASAVGLYAIVPTLVDPNNKLGNYSVTSNNGTLTINKAALSVAADSKSRAYGAANPLLTGVITGVLNGDNITATYSTSADASSPVGTYSIVPTLVDPDSKLGNYYVASTNGTLTIGTAALTVTAANAARVYGDANPTFTGNITGIQNGDDITATYSTSATQSSAAGSYQIVPTLVDPNGKLGNYSLTVNNGTLTVTKAVLTITADDKSKVYGTNNPAFTYTPSGFVNGDTAATAFSGSPSLATTATNASAVDSYTITAAAGSLVSSNYSFNFVNGALTITKAVLTVTAQDKSKVYGTANPSFTYTMTGFVNGDSQGSATSGQPSLYTTATSSSPVGSYTITSANGTLASSNYSFNFVNGTLSVTKAALTITADNKSKVYGAVVPSLSYTPTGFVNGDTAGVLSGSPSLSTGVTTNSNVGSYPITIGAGNLSAANYSLNFVNGTLTVTPAPLTIKADDKSKQYSDPLPAFTATYTGFVLGQGPSNLAGTLSLTTTATATSPANANGTPLGYPIVPSGQTSLNYAITYVNGTLTVTTENATLSYTGDSLVSPNKVGGTVAVKLAALVTEESDSYLGNTLGGKSVKFSIYKSNNTSMTTADYTYTAVISSTNNTATVNTVALPADNYTVKLELLANSQYRADVEDAIFTVVDPGTGTTSGGGWINDPNGGRGNFGFTVKYLSNGNPQGNNLYIYRTQMDLSAYGAPAGVRDYNIIFKSNAMTAMQSSTTTTPKTAKFSGKNTIKAVDRLTGVVYDIGGGINYNFQVDVTDRSEPSNQTSPDTYALRVWTTTGNYKVIGTYSSTGANTVQLPLQGGNIQVK